VKADEMFLTYKGQVNMRTLKIGLAIIICSITVFSQTKQSDLEFERIKGKVKSVQDSSIYFGTKEEPKKSPKREYYQIEFYGIDGNIKEELHSDRGIKYVYQFVDGYLSMKEVVVDKQKPRRPRGSFNLGNAEDVEDMEKPLKSIKPDERFITRYDYEYDEKGRRKLRRIFFSDGQMDSITHYSYSSESFLEKEVYNSFGNKWSYFYSYDSEGKEKEKSMERSNVKGVVDMRDRTEYSDYKFDATGNWVERKSTNYYKRDGVARISSSVDYRDIKYYGASKPRDSKVKSKK
jgi:hypothetical protein